MLFGFRACSRGRLVGASATLNSSYLVRERRCGGFPVAMARPAFSGGSGKRGALFLLHWPRRLTTRAALGQRSLLSLDGIDGEGKTTQIWELAAGCAISAEAMTLCRDPGGTHRRGTVFARSCWIAERRAPRR